MGPMGPMGPMAPMNPLGPMGPGRAGKWASGWAGGRSGTRAVAREDQLPERSDVWEKRAWFSEGFGNTQPKIPRLLFMGAQFNPFVFFLDPSKTIQGHLTQFKHMSHNLYHLTTS